MKGFFSFAGRETRKKIGFSLFVFFTYMFFCYIPLPFVDDSNVAPIIFGFRGVQFNLMSAFLGKQFDSFNIMTIGLIPYFTTYTLLGLFSKPENQVYNLIKNAAQKNSFSMDHWQSNFNYRKRKRIYNNEQLIIRGISLAISLLLGFSLMKTGGSAALQTSEWYAVPLLLIIMAFGTLLCIAISDLSTRRGLVEGPAVIILANTLMGALIKADISGASLFFKTATFSHAAIAIILSIVLPVTIIMVSVIILRAERRVPVLYAKRNTGRKMYGGQSTYLPLSASKIYETLIGFISLYFFIVLVIYMAIYPIAPLLNGFIWFMSSPYSRILFSMFILGFMLLVQDSIFNAEETAQKLKQFGGFIPGVTPGNSTSKYIKKIYTRLFVFFTLLVIIIIVLPELIFKWAGLSIWFNSTIFFVLTEFAYRWGKVINCEIELKSNNNRLI